MKEFCHEADTEVYRCSPSEFHTCVPSRCAVGAGGRTLPEDSGQLSVASDVRLSVHDLLGREVAVLVNEKKAPGSYEVKFDGSGLASGVYLYRLTARPTDGRGAAEFTQAKKLLLVR